MDLSNLWLSKLRGLMRPESISPQDVYAKLRDYQFIPPGFAGMVAPPTIDLYNRPHVANRNGTESTVNTISADSPSGRYTTLMPTVIGGRIVSPEEAIRYSARTGEHMGLFTNTQTADQYDAWLHNKMGWYPPPGSDQDIWQKTLAPSNYKKR
jgi:hypothetical protein